ncbi:MAG TPA: GNAT family N-acetyltransferase [Devosiaceae bacterium]|jgi:GNAT superfamily N-acetyltransferase
MSALAYRAATRDDLRFLVHLMAIDDVSGTSADWDDADMPRYVEALAAIDDDRNQLLFIVEKEGRSVGTFQLTFMPGIMRQGMWRCVIESVHVIPEERNQGYGKQLIRHAIGIARERGCGIVQLTSSKKRIDAHRFYRTLGFDQSHEGFRLYL